MFAFFVIPKGKIIIIVIIMITYLMLRRLLCVDILNFLFLVGIAAHKSWIEPIGQIQPQNIRFVNNNTKINTAKRKKGKTKSTQVIPGTAGLNLKSGGPTCA